MINSFGGNARNRPRVNLGGNRKELTKEELLRKAAQDRKQREITRKREAASKVIQHSWANWQARIAALDSLRNEFDTLWQYLESPKSASTRATDNTVLHRALRLFCFFYACRRDAGRTVEIARFVITDKFDDLDPEKIAVTKVFPFIIETALILDFKSPQRQTLTSAIRKTLKGRKKLNQLFATKETIDCYYKLLIQDLSSFTMQKQELSHKDEPQLHQVYEHILIPLSMNGDEGSDIGSAEVLKTFCGTVMSSNVLEDHPVLVRELKKLNLKALGMTYDEYLRSRDHTSEIIPIQLEVQLANFIAITKDRLPSEPSDSKDVWMRSLARGVSITWEAHLEVLEDGRVCGSEADLDNGEEHGLDMSVPLDVKVQSHTQRQIDELTEPEFLLGLLQPEPINGVIKYVGTLLAYLPRCRDKLLLTLSVFVTSATSPYNLLEQAYTWWTHPNATREPTLEMSLYLEVLSRVLQTMVDDEFFDPKNRIFSLAMIQSTADRLKVLACILYNCDSFVCISKNPCRLSTAYCQDLVARVLQQIQIRDSRRPFLPRDYWITANNFPMPTLTPQIALEAFQEDEEEDEHPIRHSRYQAKWYSSPRVRLLNDFPFFFAFSTRLETLQALITADSEKRGFNDFFNRATRHHVVCRREHEFEDGFGALWQIGGGIKGPLSVDYRDIHGMQEAGIDGGGLTKEFLTAVCKQAFHPSFGLFIETPERSLYPNPASSSRTPEKLQQYEFLGRIIAKCIYAGILVDVTFAPFFLLNWVGKSAYLDDLQAMDKDLYTGLIQLKNYTGDVENDLSLDFTVNEQKGSGRKATVNLLPDGSQVPVTRANRLQYIHLICHYKLNARLSKQSKAFVRGMADVLDLRWLGMFNQTEMQALVGGAPVPIDIDDLRRNTVYGGFDEQDPAVRIFWDVVREFDNEERRKLVKFVTSTPRPPLLGFKELNPKFSLRNAGSDVQRLPTASTCVNLLKLPNYTTHEQMRRKLRLSITAEAGFDLS